MRPRFNYCLSLQRYLDRRWLTLGMDWKDRLAFSVLAAAELNLSLFITHCEGSSAGWQMFSLAMIKRTMWMHLLSFPIKLYDFAIQDDVWWYCDLFFYLFIFYCGTSWIIYGSALSCKTCKCFYTDKDAQVLFASDSKVLLNERLSSERVEQIPYVEMVTWRGFIYLFVKQWDVRKALLVFHALSLCRELLRGPRREFSLSGKKTTVIPRYVQSLGTKPD